MRLNSINFFRIIVGELFLIGLFFLPIEEALGIRLLLVSVVILIAGRCYERTEAESYKEMRQEADEIADKLLREYQRKAGKR